MYKPVDEDVEVLDQDLLDQVRIVEARHWRGEHVGAVQLLIGKPFC